MRRALKAEAIDEDDPIEVLKATAFSMEVVLEMLSAVMKQGNTKLDLTLARIKQLEANRQAPEAAL